VIHLNGHEVAAFDNSFLPSVVDLTPYLRPSDNRLQIIFECPPRWLGQFGYTSRMTEWKPRFNYYWDWTARLVQIGIWDEMRLEIVGGAEVASLSVITDATFDPPAGALIVSGAVQGQAASLRCTLAPAGADDDATPIREEVISLDGENPSFDMTWQDLDIALWWPNGEGSQPLYTLAIDLLDDVGIVLDRAERTVGFRHIEWRPCEGAPEGADPWICAVNGRAVFLQGINWTPIRPNFADVKAADVIRRLELYRDLHVNLLRVWGGAVLEKEAFYNQCDALGLLVWQEFPLSSSGIDNYAPDDPTSIKTQVEIARSYIGRRRHHVSLLVWCGGNELMDDRDGDRSRGEQPLGLEHPMLRAFAEVVAEMDPARRFLPTSASGPRFSGKPEEYGTGVHWDVHGPWKAEGALDDAWTSYWHEDDALLRSEVGAPGPSSADLTRRYAGDVDPFPASSANPLWGRTSWWIEWPQFVAEFGREPATLEEYVAWGQQRQARILSEAAAACKDRFPRCGGFIVWMGHDSFPCTANTSIIDYEGNPKPAAFALAEVFKQQRRGR
jgi:beta-mannosidase